MRACGKVPLETRKKKKTTCGSPIGNAVSLEKPSLEKKKNRFGHRTMFKTHDQVVGELGAVMVSLFKRDKTSVIDERGCEVS